MSTLTIPLDRSLQCPELYCSELEPNSERQLCREAFDLDAHEQPVYRDRIAYDSE